MIRKRKSFGQKKITPIHPEKLIRVLLMAGWEISASTSKHVVLRHSENPLNIAVPNHPHDDLKIGFICQVIRKSNLTKDDYFSLLDKA